MLRNDAYGGAVRFGSTDRAVDHRAERAQAFIGDTLDEAVAKGELRQGTDTETRTRLVETTITGSLFTWATYRKGAAADWMHRDVDAVAPHLAGGR